MTTIQATTQQQLEEALAKAKPTDIIALRGSGSFAIYGSAQVTASDSAQVTASGSARLRGRLASIVSARP